MHTGTLPSKTLRETALFLSGYRQRELYGLTVELEPDLAVAKLISRKDAVRELEVARIDPRTSKRTASSSSTATARFVDRQHTIEVTGEGGSRRLTAEPS